MKLIPGKLYINIAEYVIYSDEHTHLNKKTPCVPMNEVVLLLNCKKQRKGNQTKYTFLYKSKIVVTVDLPIIIHDSLKELK